MLKVSPLISDHLVVQREHPFVVEGSAKPHATITGDFGGETSVSTADSDGLWSLTFAPRSASYEPVVLKFTSYGQTLAFSDIVVGDVWLLSGQSNMELWLSRTAHNYPQTLDSSDPGLRMFAMPQEPKFDGPRDPLEVSKSRWKQFSPKTAPDFSAVGYFFAEVLRSRIDVPIGLIATAIGGTPIDAWLPLDLLAKLGVDVSETHEFAEPGTAEKLVASQNAAMARYDADLNACDPGLQQGWAAPGLDDSKWEQVDLTDFAKGTGTFWYRKTIAIPAHLGGLPAEIFLGTAVDKDELYVDGERVGVTFYRYPPRHYSFRLPVSKFGMPVQITLAIRLTTYGDGGEFTPGKNHFIATSAGTISLDGPWRRQRGAISEPAPQVVRPVNVAGGLFQGLIAPLRNTAIKGVAWYQGETDSSSPTGYGLKLQELIKSWRDHFKVPNLPFVIQQIAVWNYSGPGGSVDAHPPSKNDLQNEQLKALELANVGLSSGFDVGEWNDLHPQGKRTVGERLSRLALRIAYRIPAKPNMHEQFTLDTQDFGGARR
jgi:sialate O-acetylesterase